MAQKLTLKGRLLALTIGCVVLIGVSEAILRFVFPNWHEFSSARFFITAPAAGNRTVSVGRAGFDGFFAQNNGDFRVRLSINGFGLRDPAPVQDADGRLWVVGDSMTFGWGVEREEMYSTRLAWLSGVPTYNVASPGTDVCGYQMLVDRMPKNIHPRAVLLGLVLENDLSEYDCRAEAAVARAPHSGGAPTIPNLSEIKSFLTDQSAIYNFFAVALKRVGFLMPLLKATGLVAQEHARIAGIDPMRFETVIASSADEIAYLRAAFSPSVPFAVLVMPTRFEIRDDDPFFRRTREAVIEALAARHIETIDPLTAFRAAGFAPTHFRHDGHWSALGHEIAAKAATPWARRAVGAAAERRNP